MSFSIKKVTQKINNKYIQIAKWFFVVPFLCIGLKAHAASIVLSPDTGTYNVGDTFSAAVYITSPDQSVNAVSGRLSFSSNKLEVTSISKSGTVINFWTIDPAEYGSEPGVVRFEGVILSPGFKGARAKVFTINFKVKAEGSAKASFLSASVLANDGKGSNILTSVRDGSFTLGPTGEQTTTGDGGSGLPLAPQIVSSTHPSGFDWYAINKASFAWTLAPDTTGVAYLVDQSPTSNPGTKSKGMTSLYSTDTLLDGVWYLHVRTQNKKGWGATTHFRFQIDTAPPVKLTVSELNKSSETSPRARFMFEAEDAGSGIADYNIEIDTKYGTSWYDSSSNVYETPSLPPGSHTLVVTAKDRAGNTLKKSATFSVEGLPTPKITDYTGDVQEGDPIVIKGLTLPNYDVVLSLTTENNTGGTLFYSSKKQNGIVFETTTQAGADGTFSLVLSEKFRAGTYQITAKATNKDGASSQPSEPVIIVVKGSGFGAMFSGNLLIPVVVAIIILAFMAAFLWYRLRLMKYKIAHELGDTEYLIEKSFQILDEDAEMMKRQGSAQNPLQNQLISQHKQDIEQAEHLMRARMRAMKQGLEEINNK